MNKKAEFLARDYVIVLVLFGMITAIGALIVVDIASEETGYNIENMTDENYRNNYNTLTETTTRVYEMSNETTSKRGMSVISTFTTMFSATFSIISLIFNSFGLITNTLTNLMIDIGVPSGLGNIISKGILVIIIGSLVFVVISSVSRGRM